MTFTYKIKPRFSDFDKYGIIHHSVYLKYMEEARIEFFREVFDSEIEDILGDDLHILVSHLDIKYINFISQTKSIYIDLDIQIVSNVYLKFNYLIYDEDKTIAKSSIKLCFSRGNDKMLLRLPNHIIDRYREYIRTKQ